MVKFGLSALKRGHITLKLVLCSAFGYTRFWVEALLGIGAFGYTRLWVVTPITQPCKNQNCNVVVDLLDLEKQN
jgi:hypothetical protein